MDPQPEPLMMPPQNQFCLYPIVHKDCFDLYKKAVACFWVVEEISGLEKDKVQWDTVLTQDERNFIAHVLGFFSQADSLVSENICLRFYNECAWLEVKAFYAFQNFNETQHSETYALLIDTFITDNTLKHKLFDAVNHFPCIKRKFEWAQKWITSDLSFAHRLCGFAIVELLLFSSSFCAVFYMKKRGLLNGLAQSNLLISRDENLHGTFACLLYSKVVNRLSQTEFHEMMDGAVQIEVNFCTEAIPVRLIGMNSDQMVEYVKYVADRTCFQMGYDKLYGAKNPFDWVEGMISLESKANFFERQVTEYSLANREITDKTFDFSADF